MLTAGNIRIAFALLASLAVHGMLLGLDTGPQKLQPSIRPAKKVTFHLVGRQPEPYREKVPQTTEKMEPEVIRKVEPLLRKTVREIPPEVLKKKKPLKKQIIEPEKKTVKAVPPVIPQEESIAASTEVHQSENSAQEPAEQPAPAEESEVADVILAVPLYRSNPPPRYPSRARRRNLQGTVILEVTVSPEGRVQQLGVKESCGHRILDKAAIASVREWLFEPGRRNGVPVSMTVNVPVRFVLK